MTIRVLSCHFCPIPKNDNLKFYFYVWNHAWKGKFRVTIFSTILKTIRQNFVKPTKAFNLENIVQNCLVSSQTHKVNKDFSNFVKDYAFWVPSDHFLVGAINDTRKSDFPSKYFLFNVEYVCDISFIICWMATRLWVIFNNYKEKTKCSQSTHCCIDWVLSLVSI